MELLKESDFKKDPPLAKIRYRMIAFFIDIFVFWLVGMFMGMFFGTIHSDGMGYNLNGLPALALFLIGLFLWPISESLWGQTIGKRFLDIKVVSERFQYISMGQALGRFFMGFIDYMFLLGIIIAATNKRKQRIGDILAKTIVVQTKDVSS